MPPGLTGVGGAAGVWSPRGLGVTLLWPLTSWRTQLLPLGRELILSAQNFLDHQCGSLSQQGYLSDDLGGDRDLGGTVMGAGHGTETSPPPQSCRFQAWVCARSTFSQSLMRSHNALLGAARG